MLRLVQFSCVKNHQIEAARPNLRSILKVDKRTGILARPLMAIIEVRLWIQSRS